MNLTIKIGGAAGEGIMAAGAIFSKALVRAGLYLSTTSEYPSLIRGGHNLYIIRASEEKIYSLTNSLELLVALNQETIELHQNELTKDGAVIYDSEDTSIKPPKGLTSYPIPLLKLATQNGGKKLMMNNVAVSAAWAVLGLPFEILENVIKDIFLNKGKEIIDENIIVAKSGYEYIKNNFPKEFPYKLTRGTASERLVLTGNEAIGLGAIQAGLEFAALYPMTPINGLLTFLASHQKEANLTYIQPEDEIAGINIAIGASYAGKKSLVASSGGGFALMVEGLGMAAMTETPLVIVMGTRPGPSSGLPTWTGQGDLKFILNSSQGEFLRVVLAPGDPEECYELTQVAFNLAEKYQTPVFLLVDKYLCESIGTMEKRHCEPEGMYQSVRPEGRGNLHVFAERLLRRPPAGGAPRNDEEYKRYKITQTGLSPRTLPGQAHFITNSYEHDEFGYSTEDAKTIASMVEKRNRKYALLEKEVPEPTLYGNPNADITLIGWGSTKGAALEVVLKNTKYQLPSTNYLHLNWINPFPKKAVMEILSKAKRVVDVEGNSTAQLAGWIREQTGVEIKEKILKYDGRPFLVEDIVDGITSLRGA